MRTGQLGGRRHSKVRATGLACLLAGSACLVTNDVTYRVENNAPSVVLRSPLRFDRVPPSGSPDCPTTADGHIQMRFDVAIVDVDVDQQLEVRVFVNDDFVQSNDAPPTTNATAERALRSPVCLDATVHFSRPCTRVRVLVSSAFDDNPERLDQPQIPYDIGSAEWFVLGGALNSADANSSSCMGLLQDGGAP